RILDPRRPLRLLSAACATNSGMFMVNGPRLPYTATRHVRPLRAAHGPALLWGLHASPAVIRTGWFVESVVSATLIVLVVRTRGPLLQSAPSRGLQAAIGLVGVAAIALPYSPLAAPLGFVALPGTFLALMGSIVLAY